MLLKFAMGITKKILDRIIDTTQNDGVLSGCAWNGLSVFKQKQFPKVGGKDRFLTVLFFLGQLYANQVQLYV